MTKSAKKAKSPVRPKPGKTFELRCDVDAVHQFLEADAPQTMVHAKMPETQNDVRFTCPGDPGRLGLKLRSRLKIIVMVL